MNELQKSLSRCKIEGNVLFLPPIEESPLKNYAEVKKALEKAGGKYKRSTFVFQAAAQPIINKLMGGEKINIKKEFQFFPTPAAIAECLVQLAEIKDGMSVLEPSAGQGAIIEQVFKAFPRNMTGPNDKMCVSVDYCELMEINQEILSKKINSDKVWQGRVNFMNDDFLTAPLDEQFDRIIANPPFEKNKDIDHIYRMFEFCKPNGRIVTLASQHWQHSKNKKETDFGKWLKLIKANVTQVEPCAFKKSGTMVPSVIIVINKRKYKVT